MIGLNSLPINESTKFIIQSTLSSILIFLFFFGTLFGFNVTTFGRVTVKMQENAKERILDQVSGKGQYFNPKFYPEPLLTREDYALSNLRFKSDYWLSVRKGCEIARDQILKTFKCAKYYHVKVDVDTTFDLPSRQISLLMKWNGSWSLLEVKEE